MYVTVLLCLFLLVIIHCDVLVYRMDLVRRVGGGGGGG